MEKLKNRKRYGPHRTRGRPTAGDDRTCPLHHAPVFVTTNYPPPLHLIAYSI